MGLAKDNNQARSVLSNNSYKSASNLPPSRLTESTENIRGGLLSRNLYTDFNEYPLEENSRQKIINSIGSVLDTIRPFSSNNFSEGVLARLVTSPNTPLTEIGLVMLGKQFLYNFKSNVAQETFPSISLRNVFDGNPDTKLFQRKIKYNITRRTENTGVLSDFIEDYFGGYNLLNRSPLPDNPTNDDLLQNTGDAQLDFLFGNSSPNSGGLNRNIYKPTSDSYINAANASGNQIKSRSDIVSNKIWFNFSDNKFDPYSSFNPETISQSEANDNMSQSYNDLGNENQYYAPNKDYIRENFGDVKTKYDTDDVFSDINNISPNDLADQLIYNNGGLNEDITNQLVWGRDGVSDKANDRLSSLRGVDFGDEITPKNPSSDFNINGGLLEYTRNLLNATEGRIVDQTRKIYTKDDKIAGFNGSALWRAPESRGGGVGIRQHTILDQYDRFAKAIRYNGNEQYNGNENSVIYKSVLPKIHPSLNEKTGEFDNNKNYMFSIENLAVTLTDGNELPESEIGSLGGRIMWFPPYDIQLNESSSANYDKISMVGRSEPIYSFMYSERSANLSFKLLMDHPEQLKNFYGNNNHTDIAKFFAFGGDDFNPITERENIDKLIQEKQNQILIIRGENQPEQPDLQMPETFVVSFPNGYPKESMGSGVDVIDTLYTNDYRYEINTDIKSYDNTSYGINSRIFNITGITNTGSGTYYIDVPVGFTQSGADYIPTQRVLDDEIYRIFNDNENVNYYKINVVGKATLLYQGDQNDYNLRLSQRRAEATKAFLEKRIEKVLGKSASTLGIVITAQGIGTEEASDQFSNPDTISQRGAKQERISEINFVERENIPERIENQTTPSELEEIRTLETEIEDLQSKKNIIDRNANNAVLMNDRNSNDNATNDSAILKGFQSISSNYYYPGFHSQTPEDFHRRLTFLQQCVRQGSAIRSENNNELDQNGIGRIKNSVFGRQPICVLRLGDFFNTKVIIENVTIDYTDSPWDMNPEGWGMQPMIADITLQMKVMGGQSLKGPIDALQNAVSYNYYANSTFKNRGGIYRSANEASELQTEYNKTRTNT